MVERRLPPPYPPPQAGEGVMAAGEEIDAADEWIDLTEHMS
jgi:hypothetical protein